MLEPIILPIITTESGFTKVVASKFCGFALAAEDVLDFFGGEVEAGAVDDIVWELAAAEARVLEELCSLDEVVAQLVEAEEVLWEAFEDTQEGLPRQPVGDGEDVAPGAAVVRLPRQEVDPPKSLVAAATHRQRLAQQVLGRHFCDLPVLHDHQSHVLRALAEDPLLGRVHFLRQLGRQVVDGLLAEVAD